MSANNVIECTHRMTAQDVWELCANNNSLFRKCNLFVEGNILVQPITSFPASLNDEMLRITVASGKYPFYLPASRALIFLGCEETVQIVALPF